MAFRSSDLFAVIPIGFVPPAAKNMAAESTTGIESAAGMLESAMSAESRHVSLNHGILATCTTGGNLIPRASVVSNPSRGRAPQLNKSMEIPENQNSERAGIGSTTLFAISDIRQNIYDHGGCRIYFEKGDKRDLICDGYQDAAFSAALRKFVDDYFANASREGRRGEDAENQK